MVWPEVEKCRQRADIHSQYCDDLAAKSTWRSLVELEVSAMVRWASDEIIYLG